jgi:hypothetical protein
MFECDKRNKIERKKGVKTESAATVIRSQTAKTTVLAPAFTH